MVPVSSGKEYVMSTKSSIAYDQSRFHFYEECFEDDRVFLRQELTATEFEANNHNITVSIPADVMDQIAAAWIKHRNK